MKNNENELLPKMESEVDTNMHKFYRELTSLINRYSLENDSDTHDWLLAKYLIACLENFNYTVTTREMLKNNK